MKTTLPLLFLLALTSFAAERRMGQKFKLGEPATVESVLANPDPYVGKTVQVKGKVSEVCQMMGCWMMLTDASGKGIRVKVNDGEIVFPKDSIGKVAIAEGTFKKIVQSREQAVAAARHIAEEQGRKFNPDSVKSGVTVYQIQGTGAVLLD